MRFSLSADHGQNVNGSVSKTIRGANYSRRQSRLLQCIEFAQEFADEVPTGERQAHQLSLAIAGDGSAETVTDLALETNAPISTADFRTLNRCLDEAIASAVTMYTRESQESHSEQAADRDNERVGFMVHEMESCEHGGRPTLRA